MDHRNTPDLLTTALTELREAAGLEGVAIIDTRARTPAPALVQEVGLGGSSIAPVAFDLLQRSQRLPSHGLGSDRRPVLVCPWTLPPARTGGLALWRMPGARVWESSDHMFASAVASLVRTILEHSPDDAGHDRLTGLPNRHFFMNEVDRHIERLDQDGTIGTLLLIDVDGLARLNDLYGRAAGDWILNRAATLLRAVVRPTDLVARVGGDEFAVWFDAMDHMTAAERAESLGERRLSLPESLANGTAPLQTISIGIASREPGSGEDAHMMLSRATLALYEAKQVGGGGWRVSHTAPTG